MILLLQVHTNYLWLAPYGYAIVFAGFLFFLFRVFETFYSNRFDKPLFRHYLVYKKLSKTQLSVIEKEFSFYNSLSKKHKRQFQHRVSSFISEKNFVGRDGFQLRERVKILIASVAITLSFGRKNFMYRLINNILIYPDEFFSTINNAYHKGEFNPRGKVLVVSWKDFEEGFEITNDKRNLGIHEFMHAMQLEAKQSRDLDSVRFSKQFQNILRHLTKQEIKTKLNTTRFFREYAFTNQFEFMAVLAEYFIESPKDFKSQFPLLYKYTKKLLNFNFADY
jgi:Mlc titration factor MtfA (ptsG expression regulator)